MFFSISQLPRSLDINLVLVLTLMLVQSIPRKEVQSYKNNMMLRLAEQPYSTKIG